MSRLPDAQAVPTTLIVVGVAVAYLTLAFRGLTQFHLIGRVSILLTYPVAIAFGLSAVAWILSSGLVRVTRPTLRTYGLAVALTLWIALRGIGGPDPVGSFTLFGIQGMGLMFLLGLTTFVRTRETLLRCTQAVYSIGAVLAAVGLGLYVAVMAPWIPLNEVITVEADNWSIIFMQTNNFIYRYTGFVGDPNFYPFYTSVAFFAGLVSVDYRRPLNMLGLTAIFLTMFLSLSRTFYVSAVGSVVVVVALLAFKAKRGKLFRLITRAGSLVTAVCFGLLAFVVARFPTESREWITRRLFGALFNDKRFTETWPRLLEGIFVEPLIGHGARSTETLLGQTAHSAFFGLSYDFGLVGFALWLALFGYGTRVVLGATLNDERLALPWLMGLLISFGMNVMNSFQYDLMLWLLLGIATAPAIVCGTGVTETNTDAQDQSDPGRASTPSSG